MKEESEEEIDVAYINKGFESELKIYHEKRRVSFAEDGDLVTNITIVQEENDYPNAENNDDSNNLECECECEKPHDEDEDVPDGGWGWIVAVGGSIGQMMVNILLACFSILYSEFLLNLGTSAVISSWIFNLMGFTMTLSGMFLRALVVEFGFRKTAYIGTLFIFIGSAATAFATSEWFLMFFYSFVAGLGIGILATLTYAIVPYYFKRRLGLANAITSSGVSAGQFVGPPLITMLQGQYGFKGATLILSAVLLHCGLGAAVFHPREWHGKRPRVLPPKPKDSPRGLDLAVRILKKTVGNLRLLKSPKSVIIALGGMLNVIGYLNFLMFMPFAMQEAGFSVEDAGNSIAISGITNLAVRLIISVMADYSWFDMRLCYMAGTLVVVVLSVVYCFITDLTSMAIVMGFWGCGVGAYMGLFNLIMVKYVGVENLMAQLGLSSFICSLWFLASGPIFGLIRDATGSYRYSMFTIAGTISITIILYLFLPLAVAYEQKREEKIKNEKKQSL